MIAAIILAGGESRRMGSPKLLLRHRGQTLLGGAVNKARNVADDVLVVVGAYAELYTLEAERAGARVVPNPGWPEGLASSVRVGVASLTPETSAALILLADQPFVSPAHLQALLGKQSESSAKLVFSDYGNVRGAPALIHRSLFPRVSRLKGDAGLKALGAQGDVVGSVPLSNSFDIDTPDDARRLS